MSEHGELFAGHDAVDFGCSKGGSLKFACTALGASNPVGIDIDPKKVRITTDAGFKAAVCDGTSFVKSLRPNCVRFCTMMHFLEHLPSKSHVLKAVESAVHIAEKYVFIRQPWFDADDYLASIGCKFYWSDWSGHTCHVLMKDMLDIISTIGANSNVTLYVNIYGRGPVCSSTSDLILPLGAGRNLHAYERSRDGEKPSCDLRPRSVYRELQVFICKDRETLDVLHRVHGKNTHLFYSLVVNYGEPV